MSAVAVSWGRVVQLLFQWAPAANNTMAPSKKAVVRPWMLLITIRNDLNVKGLEPLPLGLGVNRTMVEAMVTP